MATFAGLATLVLVDGTRQQGIATLRSGRPEPGGPRPWSGSFRPDDPGADLVGSVGANLPIELPTGETGEVVLAGVEGAGQDAAVRLVGSGPPPF
ncbi:hypothetical protein [Planosporangium mesophilum]|uniref:Uncharacterized protein n=1 Tax=Planosporangium mesophilum TaxID=689768 RepID=A0A8J3X170_9ACTN|nr:hypothetical protein [Planosporangium mesophilum]NJC84867.1 hypothetical protein [Planosporangium mesophilum]GII23511.1 hypothetical protein Pme01_31080 [Planosporangium mesophilum]